MSLRKTELKSGGIRSQGIRGWGSDWSIEA
jgi:hypothetical protein